MGCAKTSHTMGRIATSQLMYLIEITSETKALDGGSAIGGTSRFAADQRRCRVTAVDLTREYYDTARWLNQLVSLVKQIFVQQSDVTKLPFVDATFQVIFSQHVHLSMANNAHLILRITPGIDLRELTCHVEHHHIKKRLTLLSGAMARRAQPQPSRHLQPVTSHH
uniref:B1620_F3_117 n=1 Tax=Mycobacterium leprae TaxID=1769 RepID=Q49740_MYCLR|nr:B1620_F3_117 [Mycobacterium leprae]